MAWLPKWPVRAAALRAATCLTLLLVVGAPFAFGQGFGCSDPQCETCGNDPSTCKKCRSSYRLDSEGSCVPCKDPLADICTATRTITCQAADFSAPNSPLIHLDRKTGACTACPGLFINGPCVSCGPDGKCAQCNDGYSLDGQGGCRKCPPLCSECNATGCVKCDDMFWGQMFEEFPDFAVYKDAQGRCQKCTAHPYYTGCTQCDAKGRCIKCSEPEISAGTTVLDTKAGRCVKCKDPYCGKCDPQQPSKCFFCAKHPYSNAFGGTQGLVYRDSKTGKCTICEHTIDNGCLACNGRGECTRCQNGTSILRGGRCVPCSAFIGRCASCTSDGKKCLSCEATYGLKDGRCVPCPLGCYDCKEPVQGSCSHCSDNFYDAGQGICKKIPEGCAVPNKNGTCQACFDLFQLAGGRCIKSDVIQCTSQDICTKCGPDGKACVECSQQYPGFTKHCQRCKDPLCGSCQDSPTNCTSCLYGSGNPDGTSRGIYMDGTGRCQLCPSGCAVCHVAKGGVVCDQCSMQYTRVGNDCQRCKSPFCMSCRATPDECDVDSCQSPTRFGLPVYTVYRNSTGICVVGRIKGCDEYLADGSCTTCAYGYLLRHGKCVV